jgi:hypothetical protein
MLVQEINQSTINVRIVKTQNKELIVIWRSLQNPYHTKNTPKDEMQLDKYVIKKQNLKCFHCLPSNKNIEVPCWKVVANPLKL